MTSYGNVLKKKANFFSFINLFICNWSIIDSKPNVWSRPKPRIPSASNDNFETDLAIINVKPFILKLPNSTESSAYIPVTIPDPY